MSPLVSLVPPAINTVPSDSRAAEWKKRAAVGVPVVGENAAGGGVEEIGARGGRCYSGAVDDQDRAVIKHW